MIKTGILLAALTSIFMLIGALLGGQNGMLFAFVFALATNFLAYWFSGSMVLKMHSAREMDPVTHGKIISIVESLATSAGIPAPKAYIIENEQPNAFATGRNPANGAVAITTGLLRILSERELAGVIAHELAHIKNRDTLTMTVTATIAGAISMIANYAMFFGGSRNENRPNMVFGILIAVMAPFAAMIVQMAISRTREYSADATGAEISGDPEALASALAKISNIAQKTPNYSAEKNPATAHMFIMNPLHLRSVDSLFSTHPNPEERIRLLMEMADRNNTESLEVSENSVSPWNRNS